MSHVMHVSQIPPVKEAELRDKYAGMIETGCHITKEGEDLRKVLADHFGEGHPVMLALDRLAHFQTFKRRSSFPSE